MEKALFSVVLILMISVFGCGGIQSEEQAESYNPLLSLCSLCADIEYSCWKNTNYSITTCIDWHTDYGTPKTDIVNVHIPDVKNLINIENCVSPTLWVCTYPYEAITIKVEG